MSQTTLSFGRGIVNSARRAERRPMTENAKIRVGMALLAVQILLLAMTIGFRSSLDRQLERDGIRIEEMLRR